MNHFNQQPPFQQQYAQQPASQHNQAFPPGAQHTQLQQQYPNRQTFQPQPQGQQPQMQHQYAAPQSYAPQPYTPQTQQAGNESHNTSTTTTTTTTQQYLAAAQGGQYNPYVSQQPTPQPQSSIDYMQLQRQQAPKAQPKFDYMQLQQQQATPAPAPKKQAAFDYTQLQSSTASLPPARHAQTGTTTTTSSTSATSATGGKERQAAAAKGEAELRRFDRRVQAMVMDASGSICPEGFSYYRGDIGYLCGGGSHFVSHDSVDDMISRGRPPIVQIVNNPGYPVVAAPSDGWHEPMHLKAYVSMEYGLMQRNLHPWLGP